MKLMQLKEIVAKVLPQWLVSVDEAQMVNIGAECLDREEGVVYIEEFVSGTTTFNRGSREIYHFEITFLVFDAFEPSAEHREELRESVIDPAIRTLEEHLNRNYGIEVFNFNTLPKGFDANEVLKTITFDMGGLAGC